MIQGTLEKATQYKNGLTNAAGAYIGFDEIQHGIQLYGQGDKYGALASIVKGVLMFAAFYFIGK